MAQDVKSDEQLQEQIRQLTEKLEEERSLREEERRLREESESKLAARRSRSTSPPPVADGSSDGRLPMAHKPILCSSSTDSLVIVTKRASRELTNALHKDWNKKFVGGALSNIKDLLQNEEREFQMDEYYVKIIPIIQS